MMRIVEFVALPCISRDNFNVCLIRKLIDLWCGTVDEINRLMCLHSAHSHLASRFSSHFVTACVFVSFALKYPTTQSRFGNRVYFMEFSKQHIYAHLHKFKHKDSKRK